MKNQEENKNIDNDDLSKVMDGEPSMEELKNKLNDGLVKAGIPRKYLYEPDENMGIDAMEALSHALSNNPIDFDDSNELLEELSNIKDSDGNTIFNMDYLKEKVNNPFFKASLKIASKTIGGVDLVPLFGIKWRDINMGEHKYIPTPNHIKEDAGIGLRVCSIEVNKKTNTIKYGLGAGFEIPEGYFGLGCQRSSAHKRLLDLTNSGAVIDRGYRGEIFATFRILFEWDWYDFKVINDNGVTKKIIVFKKLVKNNIFGYDKNKTLLSNIGHNLKTVIKEQLYDLGARREKKNWLGKTIQKGIMHIYNNNKNFHNVMDSHIDFRTDKVVELPYDIVYQTGEECVQMVVTPYFSYEGSIYEVEEFSESERSAKWNGSSDKK